jgi:NAD-dependent SIR2 family protein deacetylase
MQESFREPHRDASADARVLRTWLDRFGRVFVLTGAGISTASGIPDYRGIDGAWKRPPPVTYQTFVADRATYRRYWARSFVGWPGFSTAQPNAGHHALTTFENAGRITALVTQNVDTLHQRAGSHEVIDLHGRLDRILCLSCGDLQHRQSLQTRLIASNPDWRPREALSAPDGDADIDPAAVAKFEPPYCALCGGMLKPDVVFFGENVPRARYAQAVAAMETADALLVVGSSLMVYSGFRFARMAHERGMSLAILNRGHTRADALADLKLESDCGEVLAAAIAAVVG